MKTIFISLTILLFTLNTPIQDLYAQELTTMTVHTKDGNTIDFQLNKHPETSFVDGNLKIVADDFVILYPIENMWKYTFSTLEAGISNPNIDNLKINRVGDKIYVSGIDRENTLNIISLDGRTILSTNCHEEEHCTIDCSTLPSGIFILKIGKTTFKIIN